MAFSGKLWVHNFRKFHNLVSCIIIWYCIFIPNFKMVCLYSYLMLYFYQFLEMWFPVLYFHHNFDKKIEFSVKKWMENYRKFHDFVSCIIIWYCILIENFKMVSLYFYLILYAYLIVKSTLIMANFGNAFSVIRIIAHRWRCCTNTFGIERLSTLKQNFAGFLIDIMNLKSDKLRIFDK